jgi:hypothetical protein
LGEYEGQPVDPTEVDDQTVEDETEGEKYDGGPIPRTGDSESEPNE